ncbi:efflux RND transporter periplasmic adaptor subunit [Catenibacillus scindens]|uniref:efflux RND transporter periplasmic adaptor subunit n=1 Tax=Catenibacillus scindens TaxID=673271 RepID=UPI00320ABBF8
MKKKNRMILIICVIVAVIAIAAAALYYFVFRNSSGGDANNVAYVDSVSMLAGLGSGTGVQNRFSGVVESQETTKVEKSADKTIKEIFVSAGDEVAAGAPLFEYDTEDTALKLEQERINLESIQNDITGYYNQIAELQKEKNKASADEQLNYTMQIQTAQTNAKRAEYNKRAKEAEIETLENDLTNATVTSPMDGIIQEVNENTTYDNMGNPKPFMTIMASGEYRVKGKVNEQNVWNLSEGQPVIIRSRTDENMTWTGTISKIDTSNTYANTDSSGSVTYIGGSGEGGQTSTSYAFYVTPDSSSDFMLGQHVFIELDNGQENAKEGLWISAMYLELEDNDAYAWVAGANNRLERRHLTLGDYDSGMDEYQILDGLTAEDYIAFPGNLLHEGMECVLNDGTHTNSSQDTDSMDLNGIDGMDGSDLGAGDMLPSDDSMITDDGAAVDDGMITDDSAAVDDGMITDDSAAVDDGIITDDGSVTNDSSMMDDGPMAATQAE